MLFLQNMEPSLSQQQFRGIIYFQKLGKTLAFPSFLEMVRIVWLKLSRELQP